MAEEECQAILAALADIQTTLDALAVDVERIREHIGIVDEDPEEGRE